MKFAELTEYFGKLETTSSRLEMTRILADLFGKAGADEGRIIAYLVGGKLGPKYNCPDTGMAEKQVVKALALAFGIENEVVAEAFKRKGDLGAAAEELNSKRTDSDLSVKEVFERLLAVAGANGQGSQERKMELLGKLVKELGGAGGKYAVKIVLSKMRGGFSDMTVLDALSWMKCGDKSLRGAIEAVYNVRADLGEVVKLVKEHEDVGKLQIKPEVGMPILVARGERAKDAAEIWERLGISAAEHKLDGLRIQAHVDGEKINLFSRGLENVTEMYPDIVEGLRAEIKHKCILDGEMIAVGKNGKYLPFQETVQRKRKYDILEMMQSVPLKYYTFDVLAADGESYLDKPNEERWQKLAQIVTKQETIRLMPRKIVRSAEEIEEFFVKSLEEGTEGIFVKKMDAPYKSGSRDFNWIKLKSELDTVDTVVMGYSAGEGKRSDFGIGEFLVGVYDKKQDKFLTITKVGSGASDEEWVNLRKLLEKNHADGKPERYAVNKMYDCDFWVNPAIVVEVKANEISVSPSHTAGFALRFPRMVSLREKSPEDATEISEIKRMFSLQKVQEAKNDDA